MVGLWMERLAVCLAVGRFLSPVVAQAISETTLSTQWFDTSSIASVLTSDLPTLISPSDSVARTVPISSIASVATSDLPTLISPSDSVAMTVPISSPSATPLNGNETTREPKEHFIKVGAGGFKLDPDSISNVSVGDTVTFEFYPTGHSIIRAEFESACVPYEYLGRNRTGFYSGPMIIDSVSETRLWSIRINSTEPIFYYCGAETSCDVQLMVGVINPNATQTLSAQKLAAKNADWKLVPGDPIPEEGRSSLSIPSSTPTVTATVTPSPAVHHSGGLSGGAIAGIVVGSVAFLISCAALFFYVGRSKSLREIIKRQDATVARTSANPEMGHSQFAPDSSGFHTSYGSPDLGHANRYSNQLPAYGQHNATDGHPFMNPHHMSMGSTVYEGMSQQEIDEMKQQQALHGARAELHSPTPGQGDWAHELEATRGQK